VAYYDALIAKWATAPAGTTDSKLTWINAQTVNGTATKMVVPTYDIYNLIVRSEFNALQTADQQSVRDIISMGTVDASANTEVRKKMLAMFPNGTATFTALANLAKTFDTPQVPWWGAPVAKGGGGLSSPVSQEDLNAAGLS
jgi:hypothetical protein